MEGGEYGIDGRLIDFGKEEEVNARVLIYELLDFVDDVVDHLGSRMPSIIFRKCWKKLQAMTDRQLKVYRETNSLISVVDYIHSQFLAGAI